MRRRTTGATHKKSDPEQKDVLSANSLSPGDLVYVDQYESSIRGRLQHTYGKEKQSSMYLSSKLVEMDRLSLPIEVEEGLGRRSAIAEAILWAEQETGIVLFAISCLLLANYKSLQL
jgi:hypothetical protein